MGFTISYRSVGPIEKARAEAIARNAAKLVLGYTWLSCEPVDFFGVSSDGRLYGDSKLNFQPHPDDAAAAEQEGLPDGTPRDLLHILAKLSRAHGVDWEISHDYSDGPVGYIRGGEVDGLALSQIGSISDAGATLGNLIDNPNYLPDENPPSASRSADLHSHEDDDEDDGRAILAFRPKGP